MFDLISYANIQPQRKQAGPEMGQAQVQLEFG